MMFNLSTKLGELDLPVCIYNASGCRCRTLTEIQSILDCEYTGTAISKTCTWNYRTGNPEPRYYCNDSMESLTTINSMGIPNLGYETYRDYALLRDNKKPYIMSVGGLSLEENKRILTDLEKSDPNSEFIRSIELNVSCPNIIGKPQLGYDMDQLENMLRMVSETVESKRVIGLKLPPYFDFVHYERTVSVLETFVPKISYLTCSNSLGNGLIIDSQAETPVIKPKNGFGGVGGISMKPVALANVRKFYELIGDKLDIVGCGGITNGVDIFDYLLCGASAVQVGSYFHENGTEVFKKLCTELTDFCKSKGYNKFSDFQGKLKVL